MIPQPLTAVSVPPGAGGRPAASRPATRQTRPTPVSRESINPAECAKQPPAPTAATRLSGWVMATTSWPSHHGKIRPGVTTACYSSPAILARFRAAVMVLAAAVSPARR